jgi:DEAD/DEAH box helicase domain-containing protein
VTILETAESSDAVALSAPPNEARTPNPEARHSHGDVHVVSRVVGFKKIKFYTNENVGSGELDLPEQQMHTTAYWLTIPEPVMAALPFAADDRRDGIVGLAFAMRQVAQLLLMCDGHDIGISIGSGEHSEGAPSSPTAADLDRPRIFVYDNYPGGIGFSAPLFAMREVLLEQTRELIGGCPCESGCPTCVGPVGNTGPLAKTVALRILDAIAVAQDLSPASSSSVAQDFSPASPSSVAQDFSPAPIDQ